MRVGDISHPERQPNGKPLDGIRILAIEQMQALPYATQLLARLGADVVKVEHPERGDLGRGALPAVPDADGRQMGATFLRNNLSKRSIGLNLKNPDAQQIVKDLAPKFDIVAENFKPGTVASFGLAYDDIAAVHPEVVYLSVSGFGNLDPSPYGHWPAYAPIGEAMAGLYSIARGPDDPLKVSPVGALGDTGTALFAVIGVLAALRQRDATGIGQYVDIAMFDAMVSFADIVPNYWSLGKDPATPTAIINNAFPLDEGEVVVQVGREHQFAKLVELIGRSDFLDDDRFADRDGWLANLDVLRDAVRAWAGSRSSIEVADALAAAGIAAAPIFTAADLVADDHVRQRNMLMEWDRSDGGDPVMTPGNPVKLSAVTEGPDTPPPTLGQHTAEVLAEELHLDEDRLAALRASGAIS